MDDFGNANDVWWWVLPDKINLEITDTASKSQLIITLVSLVLALSLFLLFSFFAPRVVEGGSLLGYSPEDITKVGSSLNPQSSLLEKNIFLVWQDNSTGNNDIYLRKSTDGGITFDNATNLSNNTGSSQSPQIESFGNNTFVVWQDNSTGNNDIYLRKSTDGGITFDNATNLSNNTGSSQSPQIESFGNNTFVVWQDNSTGNNDIYLRKSTDGGITFDNATNLSNNTGSSQSPQIESFGNNTFVVWQDNSTGNNDIYLRKSGNEGSSFGSKKNLSNNTGSSQSPQIESFGNNTFVVWQDNSTGNNDIYLRKSGNEGSSFGSKKNLSNNTGSSQSPQIESFGNNTFVVWQDNSTGNNDIYLRKSGNEGSSFGSKKNLSNNTGSSQSPQIESFGNNTFVVWQDNSTGNNDIYLRKSGNGSTNFYDPEHPPGLNTQYASGPVAVDPNLKVELVATGIKFPTHMAFLYKNDLLILEKNDGLVKRVINGTIQNESLLDVPVANGVERGMLGIVVKKTSNGPPHVFLYFTESTKDGNDVTEGKIPLGNRLYRYDLVNDKLVDPKLLLDLPSTPGSAHNGGKILVGPEGYIYLTIGDLNRSNAKNSNSTITRAQNHQEGLTPDGRAGILRITEDGKPAGRGIIGSYHPLDKYFGYGIRNSFGMAFDPLTDKLWDVENGPEYGDEINLVEDGFNSGWNKVQGIWTPDENSPGNVTADFSDLSEFNKTGRYREPELSWYQPSPGLTSVIFLNSTKLGPKYANELFVGDFHNGNIYNFKLNSNRSSLVLPPVLADKVANTSNETHNVIFARGFGGITDMELGYDGYLYVLSLYQSGDDCDPIRHLDHPCITYNKSVGGTIFRILPKFATD